MIQISDSPMSYLEVLVDEIGARPAGSPACHRAGETIRDHFNNLGLDTEEIRLDFPAWSLNEAALELDGVSLPVDVNPFSPSCEVTAPIVAVSTLPELEAVDADGKIVLLYGELSKAPIFPINFAAVQFERDQAINRLLMEKSPLAVLAVNLHPWRRVHIFEDEDFTLPSATVSVDVGRKLLLNQGEAVHLRIDTQRKPGYVSTIVGRTETAPVEQRIVLCAHYDTKIGTPGAADNGAGMSVLLALADSLPRLDLPIGLEFVAWGDEEYGAHTDGAYVARFGQEFPNLLYAINMDGIGLLTENTTLTMLAQSDSFEKQVREVARHYPAVVWVDPWIQSNHATFAMRGIPVLAFSSLTWERAHQADDTIDWISEEKLNEVMALVQEVIINTHAQSPAWYRE